MENTTCPDSRFPGRAVFPTVMIKHISHVPATRTSTNDPPFSRIKINAYGLSVVQTLFKCQNQSDCGVFNTQHVPRYTYILIVEQISSTCGLRMFTYNLHTMIAVWLAVSSIYLISSRDLAPAPNPIIHVGCFWLGSIYLFRFGWRLSRTHILRVGFVCSCIEILNANEKKTHWMNHTT